MRVPVYNWTAGDHPATGYWDQALLVDLLRGDLWATRVETVNPNGATGPGVVTVPGRAAAQYPDVLGDFLADRGPSIVVVTSDEERRLDLTRVDGYADHIWWVQNPHGREGSVRLPVGYTTGTRERAAPHPLLADRPTQVFFAGQVTHARREACVAALARLGDARVVATDRFAAGEEAGGLSSAGYAAAMLTARFAPCPGGPVLPDSFRVAEALEYGCVPIVDGYSGGALGPDYWAAVFGADVPLPIVTDWAHAPALIEALDERWPEMANVAGAWWLGWKRARAHDLADAAAALCGDPTWRPDDRITAVVTMSPVRSHPDLAILDETIASIRRHLPRVDILVACDGVRPEQADYTHGYAEAVRRLVWRCNHDPAYRNVLPVLSDVWVHQAGMIRRALDRVETPAVLVVEHDTPFLPSTDYLDASIDWDLCLDALGGTLDLIRFHHETRVLVEHRHLMIGDAPRGGFWRTIQWSQRPHLARTAYYEAILDRYFPTAARTMVEDRMHGAVQDDGWDAHRLAIYAPPDGNMLRTVHTDGRGDDPKYEMRFA